MTYPVKRSQLCAFCLALLSCAWMAIPVGGTAQETDHHDIVVAGGRVIDPETGLDAIRNIGIRDGRISAVSTDNLQGTRVIEAAGLVVSPGFIDLHSHGQTLASDRMQAFDGVTTALELELGRLPVADWYRRQAQNGRVLNYGISAAWAYARIAEFEDMAPVADIRWFQSAFSRQRWVSEPATPEQAERIAASVAQGLSEGALGVGINAGYAPGGGFRELLAVHGTAARYGVPTYTHISCGNPWDPGSSAACVGQVIALASSTGAHAHICHLNSSSQRAIDITADMILKARSYGIPISTEAYTYGAGSTAIGSAVFHPDAMAARGMTPADIEYAGERLNEESYLRLREESPGAVVVSHFLDLPRERSVLDQSVMLDGAAIASDAMPWIDTRSGDLVDEDAWPLPETAFAHPRSAGTFTRLLATWVRDDGLLDLSEAIRKSSLIPAQILENSVPQMRRKGRLQEGMDADLVVFDLQRVQDRASFASPAQTSMGMVHVLVNGESVIDRGRLLRDARPGRPVRRDTTGSDESSGSVQTPQ